MPTILFIEETFVKKIAKYLLGLTLLPLVVSAEIKIDSYTFGGLKARSIGPAVMGGRISAIDATVGQVPTIYVGSASGGVWKSKDGGIGFKPIFDEHTQSIGAIKIDPNNDETIWVGTGETWVRNTVSVGDGIYVSTDGGDKWQHKGLTKTERIAAIEISSEDKNTLFACATGALWSDSEHRGVYKTSDAGETWQKVLYINETTGCSDLVIDPNNPNIIYAGMWEFRRFPDFFFSGGKSSGLYRSTDGGENWIELTQGLPAGEKGRISLAIAPSKTTTVYSVIESDNTAIYRSKDMGNNWQKMSDAGAVQMRPFYFGELKVDPEDPDRVYKPSFLMAVSENGGKSFSSMFSGGFNASMHPDLHALWINPHNPNVLILGTDGGVYMSHDKGGNWRFIGTMPVSQFYHISHDNQWPYHVYGGLQDNGSWEAPSRASGGIKGSDWKSIGMGDGFWSFVDSQDHNTIYSEYQGGKLLKINRELGEVKNIAPVAGADDDSLRFNWNTPLLVSQTNKGTIYYGAQYLFKSNDKGDSWQRISPDLTSNDPKRQRQENSGGLTIDNSTAENNATIYSISESPLDSQLLWVGTDDGKVHVSKDGGKNWQDLSKNFKNIPAGTWVSRIAASPHDKATAFITFDGHRTGDMNVYVLKTSDYGKSWQEISDDNIKGYAWVIQQDLVNPELLFLGTEFGLFITLDGGKQWARFKENLPKVAVHDIVIHPTEHDVILATHGRGVYILDDITPIRALNKEVLASNVAMLPSRPAIMTDGTALQSFSGGDDFVGESPSETAIISYYLKKRHMFGDIKVNIYDEKDNLIKSIPAGKRRGINRVQWPMRLKPPKFPPSNALTGGFFGPRVAAGQYRVELVKGKKTFAGSINLVADPRSSHTVEDRKAQNQLSMKLYNDINDLTYMINKLDDLKVQANEVKIKLKKSEQKKINGFTQKIEALTHGLSAHKKGMITGEEKLKEKYGNLFGNVSAYNGRPSKTQFDTSVQLQKQLSKAMQKSENILKRDLNKLNMMLEKSNEKPLVPLSRDNWNKDNGMGQVVPKQWANKISHTSIFQMH